MIPDSTRAAWAALGAADPDSMSRDDTAELLDASRRVRAWLDSIELRASRRLRRLAEQGHCEAPDSMLINTAGHSGRDARDITARDELCGDHPEIEDALAAGDVTGRHLDAINTGTKRLPDDVRDEYLGHADELLARAQHVSIEQFGRECCDLAKHLLAHSRSGLNDAEELSAQRDASKIARWVDKSTGMHHTHLELDPVRDAKLNATMTRALARMRAEDGNSRTPWQQMQINAFVAAVTGDNASVGADSVKGSCAGSKTAGVMADRVPEITILIDHHSLMADVDVAAAGICETENGVPLPVSTVRRMCCDAEIIPIVLDGDGRVLDVGRSKRTATRDQRRALRAMHRTCAHPDCGVGFDACRVHHIVWWRNGGRTDLDNLIPLCEKHHHLVHEGGWQLTLTSDRDATWTRPDGTHHHTGTTINRTIKRQPAVDERR